MVPLETFIVEVAGRPGVEPVDMRESLSSVVGAVGAPAALGSGGCCSAESGYSAQDHCCCILHDVTPVGVEVVSRRRGSGSVAFWTYQPVALSAGIHSHGVVLHTISQRQHFA